VDKDLRQTSTSSNQSSTHRWALIGVQLLGLWIAVTAVAIGVRYLHDTAPTWGNYATQLALVGAAAIGFASFRRRQNRDWNGPLQQLRGLYSDVRSGKAAIESLNAVNGALVPAAQIVQELLRDLRSQETRVAELAEELRQRVAQRTEVLERRIGSLKRQSTTDTLTGLQNRRRFEETFHETVIRCKEEGTDLCVLMIDVDYFKQLNDLKGHAAGDEFLKLIGQLIRSSIRPDDEAYRLGGDEFCIVLPGINREAGQAKATSLAGLADRLAKTFKVPLPPKLSIGLSALSGTRGATAESLLAAADKHLYEIKSNRVVKSRAG